MPVTDAEIVTRLRELLKEVDMETTTERKLRQALEGQFNEDLTSKKHVIGEEVKRYLAEAEALAESEDSENDDEAAAEDSDSEARGKGKKHGKAGAPVRKKRKASASGGSRLSPEMSAFLGGVERMSRFEVVKQVWLHIKANNLQDPANKRNIRCDDKMSTIFTPPLDQFSMNKQLSRHILPKDPNDPAPARKPKKQRKEGHDDEGKPANGLTKPVKVSPELSSWLGGATEISRPQLTAAFWKYVKENGLQDPANKKNILANAELKELTGESQFSGFGFMKFFSRHLIKD